MRISIVILFVAHLALWIGACSVPKLETQQCSEARDAVKRFYSFHFGNDMAPAQENLKVREKFLTADLFNQLGLSNEQKIDYFTNTEIHPKAFRVGECSSELKDNATLQVLLFWRNDEKYESQQREVHVDAVKIGDKWLINKVY